MVAKKINNNFPLSTMLTTEHAAASMSAGTHGSTYGSNPLACAMGNAVMEIVTAPGFLENVRRRAGTFRQGLERLVASHPSVFEKLQGTGIMLSLKCRMPPADLVQAGYAAQVLTMPAAENMMHLLPALTISDAEISKALLQLDHATSTLKTQAQEAAGT